MERSSFSGDAPNLDLVRATAVLCVFFAHLYQSFLDRGANWGAETIWSWRFAQLGVLIFFVHTCFVLMLSLERSNFRGAAFFSNFYVRRFFRLYPLSILFVLGAYLLNRAGWSFSQLLVNLALVFNLTRTPRIWGVMWTLAIEVQMYLVLPILYLICVKRPAPWVLILWLLSLPLAFELPIITDRLNLMAYVPVFMGGVLAWRVSKDVDRSLPGWLWPLAFAGTTLIWLSTSRASQGINSWLFGLGLGIAIPFFADVTWAPLVRVSHVVARYSYGIYLSHPAALGTAFWLARREPLTVRWVIFFAIAIGAPVLLYHAVEKPMIDLGQRLARSWRSSPVGVVAT